MKVALPREGGIGAEFSDVDIRKVTSEQAGQIKQALYAHKLIVIRGQDLTPPQYIEFARSIGRPQIYFQDNYHHPDHPEIFVSSNVLVRGQKIGVAGTGRYWHTDYQFFDEPLPFVMVYPQVLPKGKRETYYIDMARVYENLPDELRSHVEGKRAIHDAKWRYKITDEDIDLSVAEVVEKFTKIAPPVTHPAVIQHPLTGKKSLYISSGFTAGIEGLAYEANKALMDELLAFIEKDEHIHTHTWEYGDILVWENRALLHMASSTAPGQPSVSYRIGIYDDVPFYASAN